ncbi:hypothetical protein GCM10009536_41810 [Streptomyces thermocarboxydus]
MGEAQQERGQRVPQHGRVEAQRQGVGVLVLAAQLVGGGAERGELGRAGAHQRGPVVAVEAGGLDGGAGQEAGLHGEDGSAVLGVAGEAVDLPRADPQHVARRGLVLGEVDHVPERSAVEQHHDVEVDAVHPVQGRVGAPGAVGAHGGDLHADPADAPLDREGKGSDLAVAPVRRPGTAVTPLGESACHVSHVRHEPVGRPARGRPCPTFTTGWHTGTSL